MSGAESPQRAMIAETWVDLSQQRLAWAFRAYHRFIDSLSEETRERFAKGDAQGGAYVVVFGKTQVGKTTLLLDLMGLVGAALARVSRVLRGEREHGKSATATAMEYRHSSDDQWSLDAGLGLRTFHSDEDMEAALGEVRRNMSQQRLVNDNPVIVWIPTDCFADGKSAAPRVRMLDLPGDNPADQVERAHVQKMARRYVPHADLILLVGRGDDLSFLRPDALELPSIEDWQIVPGRFRIVTTYSFTAKSVRDLTRQQQTVTPEFFRRRLLEQIRTFGLELGEDASCTDRFFPLEFGHSWVQAGQRQGDLVQRLEPIVSELKRQLHADIAKSATEVARLRNAVDVHVVVRKVKQARLARMDADLEPVCSQYKQVRGEWAKAKKFSEQTKADFAAVRQFLDALPKDQLRQQVQRMTMLDIDAGLKEVESLKSNTSAFRFLINEFTSNLKDMFLAIRPSIHTSEEGKKFWASVQPRLESHIGAVGGLVDREFAALRKCLSDYILKRYFPSSSDNFDNDKQKLCRSMRDSAKAVGDLALKIWWDSAEKRFSQFENDMQSSAVARDEFLLVAMERLRECERLGAEIERMQQKRDAFVRKMEADETSGRRFVALLEQEYLNELSARRQCMAQAETSTDALLDLLAATQLIEERNKIMIGMK